VRGGGGEVGLSCYNNYELCKAIASFSLPVLTGIGHSTNMTVAELVAFRNAITPTELADFLLQTFHDFSVPVNDARKALRTSANRIIETSNQLFSAETKHFKNSATNYLLESKNSLVLKSQQFKNEAKTLLTRNREHLHFAQKECLNYSNRLFKVNREKLAEHRAQLPLKFANRLAKEQQHISEMENMVRLMDPKNVLKRGYSITTINGQTLQKNNPVEIGDTIKTITFDFELTSTIVKKEEHGE
jgi:exodeoxyribonuclease VII large subunit